MAIKQRFIADLLAVLPDVFELVVDERGMPFAIEETTGNPIAHRIRGSSFDQLIRVIGLKAGFNLSDDDVRQVVEGAVALTKAKASNVRIWRRVAPHPDGGVIIDVGDEEQHRIIITPEGAEVAAAYCSTLFDRSPSTLPMVLPAEEGDWRVLLPYLNMAFLHKLVFMAWLTYTLASPKVPATNYVLLLLYGPAGTGKSALSGIIRKIVDPSLSKVSVFPRTEQDMVLAVQGNHLNIFDNLRAMAPKWSDLLCITCTGGTLSTRQLYRDEELCIHQVHGALVLNGLSSFVDQSDLAERTLPIRLLPLDQGQRVEEHELMDQFDEDLPCIMRGVLDLTADIMHAQPGARVVRQERMLGFVRWLAAMEEVIDIDHGKLQRTYSELLRQSISESLYENAFAAVLFRFAENLAHPQWTGGASELLDSLEALATDAEMRSSDWPKNEIQLGRRMNALESGLSRHGLRFERNRGRLRTITIHRLNVDE